MTAPRAVPEILENSMRRLVLLRLIASTLVVGAAIMVLQFENRPLSMAVLYGLLGLMYLSTGISYLAFRGGVDIRRLVLLLVGIDLAVLTMIVHFGGGTQSYFTILYILPIIVGGEYFQVGGGVATSLIATSIYVIYSVLEPGGVAQPQAGAWPASEGGRAVAGPILRGYLHMAVFIFSGLVSGHVSRRLQRKHAEIACKDDEIRRMRFDTNSILRNMSSGLIVTDVDGKVLICNPAARAILGLPAGSVALDRRLSEMLPHIPQLAGEIAAVTKSGAQRRRDEIEIAGADGSVVPIGISITPLRVESGGIKGAIAIFQDLTEVRMMHERIRRADRLAAVGELSAAIAHEVRAPLASICGSIDILRGELRDLDGDNAELMDLVMRESDRLDGIITDFLEFARLRPPEFSAADIGKCIAETALLLRHVPGYARGMTIRVETEEEQDRILADEEQIRQVMLNLGMNACEAVRGRGTLTISNRTVARRLTAEREAEECIEIDFHNDGPPIPPEVLPRVFEPFFTTKEGGTGLGLAITARIVESHGGLIRVCSTAEEGTTFTVVLPVCCAAAEGAPEGVERSCLQPVEAPCTVV